MKGLAVVILAAGEGKRMRSSRPKVMHALLGRPMIAYSADLACSLKPERIVVVVGVGAQEVKEYLRDWPVRFALQQQQLGTGHAVLCARPALQGFRGDVFIQYGDAPLLTAQTVKELVQHHRKNKAALSLVTAVMPEPYGYGRILRDARGTPRGIVEEPDCTAEQRQITEVNPGIYLADAQFLFRTLPKIKPNNQQKEIYLTDLLGLAVEQGAKVSTITARDYRETLGVNSRSQLAFAAACLRERTNIKLMDAGVSIEDPACTYIDPRAKVGRETLIEPGVKILGETVIGPACLIQAHSRIEDSRIDEGVFIGAGSVIEQSRIRAGARVGPMAHLRPGSDVGRRAKIGNFVELKKTKVGARTSAAHLTYLGDAILGRDINVGCGTITCNYDGEKKYQTIIEDEVFVGSDTQLIAPVRVGRGAYIGSGSTITKDVPAGALALSRAPEIHKPGWAKKKKRRLSTKSRH